MKKIASILTLTIVSLCFAITGSAQETFDFVIETSDTQTVFRFAADNAIDLQVDWGDGSPIETFNGDSQPTYDYQQEGTWIISVKGKATRIAFYTGENDYPAMLKDIHTPVTDGINGILSASNMFRNTQEEYFTASNFFDEASSGVTSMANMFQNSAFNQDISSWDVSNVTDMSSMFNGSSFNQDIGGWVVSSVSNMWAMFAYSPFNRDIGDWDVSNVTDMRGLFSNTPFNQDIGRWDVSSVTRMGGYWVDGIFSHSSFNQDISSWDVSNVMEMARMFQYSDFDQDISDWDVSNVEWFNDFLRGSQISTDNYNNLLIRWSYLDMKENLTLHAGSSQYDLGLPEERREYLTDVLGWTIIDDGDTGQEFNKYHLHIVPNPQGAASFVGKGIYNSGDEIDIEAIANHFFDFVDWETSAGAVDNPTSATTTFTMPAEHVTITANFTENTEHSSFDFVIQTTADQTDFTFVVDGAKNLSVFWQEGAIERYNGNVEPNHDFGEAGEWTVRVYGEAERVSFFTNNIWPSSCSYAPMLLDILSPVANGLTGISSAHRMFMRTQVAEFTEEDFFGTTSVGATDMSEMFRLSSFNQGIATWNVSNVTNMESMFHDSEFNQVVVFWNVSKVNNMASMFRNSPFNQDLGTWNIGNVQNMFYMFQNTPFNRDIGSWDVSAVSNMAGMFWNTPFDQDIGDWDVSNVTNFSSFLTGGHLSVENYNSLLLGWSELVLQADIVFNAGTSQYEGGTPANSRQKIINDFGWTIHDGGVKTYSLTFNANPGGAGTFEGQGDYYYTQEVPIKALENNFFEFEEWETPPAGSIDNLQANETTYTMPKQDITLTANFNEIPYDEEFFHFTIRTTDQQTEYKFTADDAVDLLVIWDEDSSEIYNGDAQPTFDFGEAGEWVIGVQGQASRICFNTGHGCPYAPMLTDITPISNGVTGITSTFQMFWGTNVGDFWHEDFLTEISGDITNMAAMFWGVPFNQDISQWDVSNVTYMNMMFYRSTFNQDISGWDVSSVTRMDNMFYETPFNQDIGQWEVANVTNMSGMFWGSEFNQNIGDWDVSSVTNMSRMFRSTPFNQDISRWDVSNVNHLNEFLSASSLSPENYSKLLVEWSYLPLRSNLMLSAGNSQYDLGPPADRRQHIIEHFKWTITDGGDTGNEYDLYNIHIETVPLIGGQIIGRGLHNEGDVVSINAIANPFFKFDRWEVTAGTLGDNESPQTTLTMPAEDVTLTAHFNEHPEQDDVFTFVVETTSERTDFKFIADNAENLYVLWSNNNIEVFNGNAEPSYDFGQAGEWTIRVKGKADRISFYTGWYCEYSPMLRDITTPVSDGVSGIISTLNMFRGTQVEGFTAEDFFDEASAGVTSMNLMFSESEFNQPINSWDVSSVTNMAIMFASSSFNQDISAWDVSRVTNMQSMFNGAQFNQNIGGWQVGSVTNMSEMFRNSAFNQSLEDWDVSSVTNMHSMFYGSPFNQSIGSWNVSNVENMASMFSNSDFNQGIGSWDVSNVTSMNLMFSGTPFNQDIGQWDVGAVTDMSSMFASSNFNQDIGDWDVSSVTNMGWMFYNTDFDQDISQWDVSNVTNFSQFLSMGRLSTENYNSLLTQWALLNLQSNVSFHAGSSIYEGGEPANSRQHIIDEFGWSIADRGVKTYSLTLEPSPGGSGSMDGEGNYYYTQEVTIKAIPSSFYQFVEWETPAVGTIDDINSQETTYVMPAQDVVLTAIFEYVEQEDGYFIFTIETNEQTTHFMFVADNAVDLTVIWDDENTQTYNGNVQPTFDYGQEGEWIIKVQGEASRIAFYTGNSCVYAPMLRGITPIGNGISGITSTYQMFKGTNVGAFWHPEFLNSISGSITDMREMFMDTPFNQDISNWDVSNVTTMNSMFANSSFNRDIGNWDVTNVTSMASMFSSTPFNQNLSGWNVSSVTDMSYMFHGSQFNHDIGSWDVGSVTQMHWMFRDTPFNQPLSNWDVSSVTNMSSMFSRSDFNRDINDWGVSSVTNMSSMFNNSPFNQNLSSWNVSSVTDMGYMFSESSFGQDISDWNVSSVRDLWGFLQGCTLSTEYYNSLLIKWSYLNLQSGVTFDGGQSMYDLGLPEQRRQHLTDELGWTITDGGPTDQEFTLLYLNLIANPMGAANFTGGGFYSEGMQVDIAAHPKDGYTFTNWTNAENEVISTEPEFTFEMPAYTTTLTANLNAIDYQLTTLVNPEGAGAVSVDPEKESYNVGDWVDLSATLNDGYLFVNWTDGEGQEIATTRELSFVFPAHDATITANYEPIDLSITVTIYPEGEAGSISITPEQDNYYAGQEVTLVASPAQGYQFDGWDGPFTGTSDTLTIIMPAWDIYINANFSMAQFLLSVVSNPTEGGETSFGSQSGQYALGEEINLSAYSNPNYIFTSWTDDQDQEVSDKDDFIFVMPARDVTLTANFSPDVSVQSISGVDIKVYPNPSSTHFTVEAGEPIQRVWLVDLSGRRIAESIASGTPSATVSVQGLPAGQYIMQVQSASGMATLRVQVQR